MTKRLMTAMMVLVLILCGTVFAEETAGTLESGKLVLLANGAAIDLDGDGTAETISFEITRDEDGYDTGYKLTVGESQVGGVGWYMNEEVYALRLTDHDYPLVLVSDNGPSDDYETHFYLYADGMLQPAGVIYALPESMEIDKGIITAPVRANLLYTWFHDEEYALAYRWYEDGSVKAAMHKVPRGLYPMSLIATLNVDLPLMASRTSNAVCAQLESGAEVILCATDDVEWVYIEALDGSEAGWMKTGGEFGMECYVGEKTMPSYDVFEGLLFAD